AVRPTLRTNSEVSVQTVERTVRIFVHSASRMRPNVSRGRPTSARRAGDGAGGVRVVDVVMWSHSGGDGLLGAGVVLDAVGGEAHERLLERGVDHAQLVQVQAAGPGDVADLLR